MAKEAKIIIGIVIASVVGLIIAAFTLGGKPQSTSSTPVDTSILIRDDSYQTATQSAKVTLVEFGDFQCPSCAAAYPIVKQVMDYYNGQINFVFRNFPLPQHVNAQKASEAAEAAGAQGKYWEMYDLLYQRQNDWAESKSAEDIFVQYAASLDLDQDKFRSDLDSNKFFDKVFRDKSDGNSLGVNSTPTFFINSRPVVGVLTLDQFKSEIDKELAQ